MSQVSERAEVEIRELPDVVNALIARAAPGTPALGLQLTYLRRKAGRGLVAVYRVAEPAKSPFVHLSVDERALNGMRLALSRDRYLEREESVSGDWPGIVKDDELGIALQGFPADADLPALAAACDPTPAPPLADGLSAALAALLGPDPPAIAAVAAEPLRYKPGNRCLLRYRLELADGGRTSLVGKVYADAAQAGEVYRLTERLYAEQSAEGESPLLPRPLGLVKELGLILSEDLATGGRIVAGTAVLRPGSLAPEPPADALRTAAAALARLHRGGVRPAEVRGADEEAARARKRAKRLGEVAPSVAERCVRLADLLEEQLASAAPERHAPSHGSFKPAQLVFRERGDAFITDFDQFCLADPALDVGYFLAYLRPAALWYGRPGSRAWFEAARRDFLDGYRDTMTRAGWEAAEVEAIESRSRAYQAGVLFKLANRRPNRLQSPRPAELDAMLSEIERCLVDGEG